MLKLLKYFLWIVVLLALALGFDQIMLKSSLSAPGLEQTQRFYVDFRTRLLGLIGDKANSQQATSIDAVIEQTAIVPPKIDKKSNRYLYVDQSGTLQFADNLQQVPSQYRQEAQPLAE